jgi:hypothetical protein
MSLRQILLDSLGTGSHFTLKTEIKEMALNSKPDDMRFT